MASPWELAEQCRGVKSLKRDKVPDISQNHILRMSKERHASRASHPSSESIPDIFTSCLMFDAFTCPIVVSGVTFENTLM
jgi:hypothetical protein